MYHWADIRMTPGPQRGMLMIGIQVCTKSIKFLRLKKTQTFHLRCSASQRRSKYSSLLWGHFHGWLLTLAFGAFLCQTGVSAGMICLSITATSQCSLNAQITLLLWGCMHVCAQMSVHAAFVSMCVCMPDVFMLEVLICHLYKITAGADFMQRMSTS